MVGPRPRYAIQTAPSPANLAETERARSATVTSDLYGVLYIELDNRGEWKLELAKELKAAGLKINMDRVL